MLTLDYSLLWESKIAYLAVALLPGIQEHARVLLLEISASVHDVCPKVPCDVEVSIKQSLLSEPESCIIAVGVYFARKAR